MSDHDFVRLSDLLHLCAATMRTLAAIRLDDGQALQAHVLAFDLDRIAIEAAQLSSCRGDAGEQMVV